MVFRKSICNLSKYGKKNDELFTPVLNDYLTPEFKSRFYRSLVTTQSRDFRTTDDLNKPRSNSFNRSPKYISTERIVSKSNTYKRSHTVSFPRKLNSSLTSVNEFNLLNPSTFRENNSIVETSNLQGVRSTHEFDIQNSELSTTNDHSNEFNSLKQSPASYLTDDLFDFSLPKIDKKVFEKTIMDMKNDLENRELLNEKTSNKNELRKRFRIGAFTPMGLGLLDGGALNSLTIKQNGRSKSDLARSPVVDRLLQKVEHLVNVKREKVAELHKKYSDRCLGEVTLGMLFSGLKDVPAMVTETSELDPYKGIRFRGLTVDELLQKLPGKNPDCPYTESVLWFLLTGEVPTTVDVEDLSFELYKRSKVPDHVFSVLNSLPRDTHPMTQYVTAVSALQTESVFRKAYFDKTYNKDTCWKLALEDCLDLFAKNVVVVGYIYRRSFLDEKTKPEDVKYNSTLDYAANLSHFLGNKTELFADVMRLYLALHSDHEGGNVSAHASHLVGSALTDPYFCFASALCGLSGPLHGMANQECLVWIKKMLSDLGNRELTVEEVKKYAEDTMAKRQVIPGYGHAVLKVTDPRHTAFVRFALKHFPDDPLVKLLDTCLKAIPEVLRASGKVRNPNPNVDCSTGVLLSHFKVDQPQMFTVLFGLSRSMGILSQLVWARALRYPIERPKSLSLETVERMCNPPE